jgi:hypothetical protein
MSSGPTDYPSAWTPRGAPQARAPAAPAAPAEAIAMAVDSYVASLSDDEFRALVERTRGPQ